MLYLNKLLLKIKENPTIFKSQDIILTLGITSSQIKELKKHALENQLITQSKQEYFLTHAGKEYLEQNPLKKWSSKEFPLRPETNVESLKEEKAPPALIKAIRLLAKHFLEKENLKENSLEHALLNEYKVLNKLSETLEKDLLCSKKVSIENIYKKYSEKGITKSLISIAILKILADNIEKIAIYEKSQFQLRLNQLMFDRIMACPQNFEIQKTEMDDEYILKDISKIILNKKSNNILEITKGLIATIRSLDKYTMQTQNISKKTARFRNIIVNAKDPISLFVRDIPKVLDGEELSDCDRQFLNSLKTSLDELKNCTTSLINELKQFLLDSFGAKSKTELCERFLKIKDYIGENELKILLNNVIEIDVSEDLWINRIATFINRSRVPKDWTDEDFADFKVKTKELSLKFSLLEATVGTNECKTTKNFQNLLDKYLKLTKQEKLTFMRKIANILKKN